uniref:Microtubule-associated tumor suppressor 1 n=1 Tax=Neogobius melanostomus TaxID=47308 RepID=A0A8C6WIW4_9GOBI
MQNQRFESSWNSTMSEENFNLPCEHQAAAPLFLANRGRLLDIDGTYSLSLTPDSASCNFNLCESGDSSGINPLSTDGPIMQQGDALSQRSLSSVLDPSFITTSDNGSIYLWGDTFSILSNQHSDEALKSAAVSPDSVEMSSCGTSCRGSVDLSFSSGEMVVRSNSSVLEDQAALFVVSSFEESAALVVTSPADTKSLLSPMSEQDGAGSHAFLGRTFEYGDMAQLPCEEDLAMFNPSMALPGEKGVGTTFLCENSPADCANEARFISPGTEILNQSNAPEMPDQDISDRPTCAAQDKDREMAMREKPAAALVVSPFTNCAESKLILTSACGREGAGEHVENHPCLGMTFAVGDNIELSSEEDAPMCKSSSALPGEKASLHATFLCENSPADCANEAQFICSSQAEILSETYTHGTPVQAVTFDGSLYMSQDADIWTSTPLQNIRSNMPSLPSFTASPCTVNTDSPALRPVLRKRNPVTPKQIEGNLSISDGKVTKMEISKFPKSDLSRLKCKREAASSSALLDKPLQMNNKQEGHKVGSFKPSPTRSFSGLASPLSKAVHNSQRRNNSGANEDQINQQKSPISNEVQRGCKTLAGTSAVLCSPASPDAGEGTSSQTNTVPKAHSANATFCYRENSPLKSNKTAPKPTPKKDVPDKIKNLKSGHEKSVPKTPKSSPCTSSESATTMSRLLKMAKPCKLSDSLTLSKTENLKRQSKPASQDNSQSRAGGAMESMETNCRNVKKIGLLADPPKSSTASCRTDPNARVHGQPSPMKTTPLNKQRLGTSGRENCRTTATFGTPLSKKPTDSQKATRETSVAASPSARTKPASSQRLQTTPPRSSLMGPPLTPVPRLQQRKVFGSRNQSESAARSETCDGARAAQVSGVALKRATPYKVPIFKARLTTTPAKSSIPVLTTSCKAASTVRGLPNAGHISLPKRTTTAKLIRPSASVDKGKAGAGARLQQQQGERNSSRPQQGTGGARDAGLARVTEVQHLQTQLTQSNNRSEALAVVLQQTLDQRDEAVRQSRGLSQELQELRGELMHTVNMSEGLAQEKEALKASLQEALEQVQAQHQRDLLELEERLREQHQIETSAALQRFQEEAERSRERLQLQLEELSAAHEVAKQDLETSHSCQLQSVRQQHQLSLQDFRDAHALELQTLNQSLKAADMVFSEKIRDLTRENAALTERLAEEENRNRDLSQDSHMVYLEREMESLKVVLEMKTEQLHQQEKKLMEVDKLAEKNVWLGESLRKVQQENEDLMARMERHAALSRQLSSEQTQLQESLHKESKVNKRLSMENEELLWKLHNGDLSGSTPPSPFKLQSPRKPPLFSSPPVSPR